MSSMESKKTKIEDVIVDKDKGRVLVSVSLSPRVGRERTVRISAADVRNWLQSEKEVKAEALVSGQAIHNNMSRRLGAHRTAADLSSVFVFELEKPKPKAAPKKTTTSKTKSATTKAKATVTSTKSAEPKKTTSRRRSTSATRRKSTTVKKGDK